jgi:hypothetical protein
MDQGNGTETRRGTAHGYGSRAWGCGALLGGEVAAVVVKPAAATSEVQRLIAADFSSWQQPQPTDRRLRRCVMSWSLGDRHCCLSWTISEATASRRFFLSASWCHNTPT